MAAAMEAQHSSILLLELHLNAVCAPCMGGWSRILRERCEGLAPALAQWRKKALTEGSNPHSRLPVYQRRGELRLAQRALPAGEQQ